MTCGPPQGARLAVRSASSVLQPQDGLAGPGVQPSGREAVDLFVRSYQTLLRSTGEVRVAGLLEPYLALAPSLHVRARDALPDAAAITYVGLRLPPCMPS